MATNIDMDRGASSRRNHSAHAVVWWLALLVLGCACSIMLQPPVGMVAALAAVAVVALALRSIPAYTADSANIISGVPVVDLMNKERLLKAMKDASDFTNHTILTKLGIKKKKYVESIYLGEGYRWQPKHSIRAWEFLSGVEPEPEQPRDFRGKAWIQQLDGKVETIGLPTAHTSGNVAIYGTTGAGKTKLYILLIKQAILRGEPVLVLDPKGDKDLENMMRDTCASIGKPEKFAMLHPGFPEKSIRLNLLANFSNYPEVASRIAALLPEGKGNESFTAYIAHVLINLAGGMLMVGEKVTLRRISAYIHNGTQDLLTRCIVHHAQKHRSGWENEAKKYTKDLKKGEEQVDGFIKYYRKELATHHPSAEIDGLIDMTVHDKEHFSKMIVSLNPVLTFLTAADMGPLLSPNPEDIDDNRPISNLTRLMESGAAFYVGLNTLPDEKVGSAISNLLLADLAAFAGDRYNYTDLDSPINVFGDEARELMTSPFVRVLNKARGAGVRTWMAAQTFSDYVTALGSKEAAHQASGNANTIIALRQHDTETQKEIVGDLPKVSMAKVESSVSSGIEKKAVRGRKGSLSTKTGREEIERIPASMLTYLPDFEYFARFPSGDIVKGRIPIAE